MRMIGNLRYYPGYLDRDAQVDLVDAIRTCLGEAPLYTPEMPRTGKLFSVRMSNAGPLGWVSDRGGGYRYQAHHPATGRPWPAIPPLLHTLWNELSGYDAPPEACLINWYGPDAKMGLHVDSDEAARDAPVLSVSLGDTAVFRVEVEERKTEPRNPKERARKTRSMRLESGDVVLLAGATRNARHGVDRILAGSSTLLNTPGRINLTLRRVTVP